MTTQHNGALPDLFTSATRLRIANLTPTSQDPASSDYIEAVVALIWPYSSSTRVLSLLLAEPDVRLRKGRGQVKVTFHADSARAVAKSQVGIGDLVRLRLSDATWTETGDVVSTPGKKVDWDLEYKLRVILTVSRNGTPLASVDFEGEDTPPPPINGKSTNPTQVALGKPINGDIREISIRLSSPATSQTHRVSSGSFLDASLDPFAESDGFVVGKGRKRTKFALHSGSWRLLDDRSFEISPSRKRVHSSPSNVQVNSRRAEVIRTPEVINLDDTPPPEPASSETEIEVASLMPPPTTPIRRPPGTLQGISPTNGNIITPRLHPLTSPGLPLVSPLVKTTGVIGDYFGEQQIIPSELDEISYSPTSPATERSLMKSRDRESTPVEDRTIDEQTVKDMTSIDLQAHQFDTVEPPSILPNLGRSFQDKFGINQEVSSSATLAAGLAASDEQLSQSIPPTETMPPPKKQIFDQDEEEEEEDMYGASEVARRQEEDSQTESSAHTLKPGWQDKLSVSAVESGTTQTFGAPPFPFQQSWHKKKKESRRSSPQASFMDGNSNEVSGSVAMDIGLVDGPFDEQLPLNAEIQNVWDLNSSQPFPKFSQQGSKFPEESPQVHPPVLQGDESPQTYSSLKNHQAVEQLIGQLPFGPPIQKIGSLPIEDASVPRNQLMTPDNTQQGLDAIMESEVLAEILENQLPPTPENTQEPDVASLPQVDGRVDLQFIKEKDTATTIIPTTEIDRPSITSLPPKPTRKSLNLQGISSPYFTPRRSTRITPDLQSPTFQQQQALRLAADKEEYRRVLRSQDVEIDAPASKRTGVFTAFLDSVSKSSFKTGLNTPLSYYVPLSNLSEHYNQQVDVLAVCTATSSETTRAKSGPKDYNTTLHTVDPSLTGNLTITVQLFRPYKKALPYVQRGDVILLRAMKVQSQKRKCMLLSTDSSAWATYPGSSARERWGDALGLQVNIPGPPVECGNEEIKYANQLMKWWETNGSNVHALPIAVKGKEMAQKETASKTANDVAESVSNGLPVESEAGQNPQDNANDFETTRVTRSSRRIANLTDNIENADEAIEHPVPLSSPTQVSRTSPRLRRHSRSISAISTAPSDAPAQLPLPENIIHELRDGTRYVDQKVSRKEKARRRKEGSVVHELRDGVRWVDD